MDDLRQNGGAPAWTFVAVLAALVFLCGCTTVTITPEAKGFSLADVPQVLLAKEIAEPVRWEWDQLGGLTVECAGTERVSE